jgi:hypothetical protein
VRDISATPIGLIDGGQFLNWSVMKQYFCRLLAFGFERADELVPKRERNSVESLEVSHDGGKNHEGKRRS